MAGESRLAHGAGSPSACPRRGPPLSSRQMHKFEASMFKGSIPALVTPMQNGSLDEEALPRLRRLADPRGLERPGAGRHDRRIADAVARRAPPRRRDLHRDGERPRAGDRRRRLEQHQGGDRARQSTPRRRAPTPCSSSRPITTSRVSAGSTRISAPSPTRSRIPLIIYNIPPRSVIDMSVETMARASSRL